MLLIYPPLARSAEPPLGVARLAGALRASGIPCSCLDLCQEGYDYLLSLDFEAEDQFSSGAKRRRERGLALLRSPEALENRDRYARAVRDLNRCLSQTSKARGLAVSLSDYQDGGLSPLRREDLAAAARGYRDNIFFPLYRERLEEALGDGAHGEIGVSLCFLSQVLPAFALLGLIRDRYPGKRIVLGGSLIGSWAGQGRLAPREDFGSLVDAVLPGKGEVSLLEWITGNTESALSTAEGARASAAPDFSDFAHLEYLSPKRILPYNFSSGCPWRRCRFCPERAEGRPYSTLDSDIAQREISEIIRRYSPDLLHFTDSEIVASHLRFLADSPPGRPWYGFARFSGDLLDASFCRRLAASGCVMLQLGLESGDQAVLDALDKGTKLADVEAILRNLKAAGIGTFAYVLFGTREEDLESARKTLSFVEKHAADIDFLNVAIFNLPAAGPEASGPGVRDFSPADLSLYREFDHPAGWNRGRVRAFLKNEFEASPIVRPILLRSPPSFTSNHAAFFLARDAR